MGTAMDGLTVRRATGTIRTTPLATAEEGGEVRKTYVILGIVVSGRRTRAGTSRGRVTPSPRRQPPGTRGGTTGDPR